MIFDRHTGLMEFAYYISPDGVQYPLFGGKRVLMSWQALGMPPINYLQDRGPFQNGVTVRDFRLEPRLINLQLFERGCKRNDFWCHEAALIDSIRSNRSSIGDGGTLLFIRPDLTEIEIGSRILQGPTGDWDGTGSLSAYDMRESLRFFCEDPVWRLPTALTETFSATITGACLDTCLDTCIANDFIAETTIIPYTGTWEGDQITIAITGPMTSPEIINNTTGQSILLNYIVSSGETVTITILPNSVTVTNNLGVNLIGTVSSTSDLSTFSLVTAGNLTSTGNNSITVIGTGIDVSSEVTFTYFVRHISAFVPC
jgi:hypothetical protein